MTAQATELAQLKTPPGIKPHKIPYENEAFDYIFIAADVAQRDCTIVIAPGSTYAEAREAIYLTAQRLIVELDLEVEKHRQHSLKADTSLERFIAEVEAKLSGASRAAAAVAGMVEQVGSDLIKFDTDAGTQAAVKQYQKLLQEDAGLRLAALKEQEKKANFEERAKKRSREHAGGKDLEAQAQLYHRREAQEKLRAKKWQNPRGSQGHNTKGKGKGHKQPKMKKSHKDTGNGSGKGQKPTGQKGGGKGSTHGGKGKG